jgi:methylase of polypeptide subunit release factors
MTAVALLRAQLAAGHGPLHDLLVEGMSTAASGIDAATVDLLESLGLLAKDGQDLTPVARVGIWEDLLVAHDSDRPHEIGVDTVLGVNNTTRALAALTPRTPGRRALDVATGPGPLALLLARHCETVVATDLSERACAFARGNARLNDLVLDVRAGDLYAPVEAEEPFDVITGNLPFVVSPDTTHTFRDGGRDRDGMSREAVSEAVAHLAPGGTAVLMCNWTVPADVDPGLPPLDWVSSTRCSVVVLHHSTESPDDYAERWNKFLLSQDAAAYLATVDRWKTAFGSWDIAGIANGAVIVHVPVSGPTFRQTFPMRLAPHGDGGSQVRRILENGAWLAGHPGDEAILAVRPNLLSPHRLEQAMHYDGSWTAEHASMVLTDTAGVTGTVHPLATHVVLRLDGAATISDIVDEALDVTGLDRATLQEATVSTVRELLARGCLGLPA